MRATPFIQTPGRRARPAAPRVALGLPLGSYARRAAYAGLVTLLIGWLSLALFLAPYWAAQTNFPGHQHPDGAPHHTHIVQAVLGYALAVTVAAARLTGRPAWPPAVRPAVWLGRTLPRRH